MGKESKKMNVLYEAELIDFFSLSDFNDNFCFCDRCGKEFWITDLEAMQKHLSRHNSKDLII